jgi:pimeloyl-ACP methyl ester carboxylesterase
MMGHIGAAGRRRAGSSPQTALVSSTRPTCSRSRYSAAASYDNPDHVDIVIHNYRWRLSLAKGETRYDDLERKLAQGPVIDVPAITIASDFDGAAADGMAYAKKFSGKYSHRILNGIGHNVPQEAPEAFAQAVVDVDGLAGSRS